MSWVAWEVSASPFRELLRVALVHGVQIRGALLWALVTVLHLAVLFAVLFCLFKARMAQIRYMRSLWSPLRGPDGKPRPPDHRLLWESGRWLVALFVVGAAAYPLRYLVRWAGL